MFSSIAEYEGKKTKRPFGMILDKFTDRKSLSQKIERESEGGGEQSTDRVSQFQLTPAIATIFE